MRKVERENKTYHEWMNPFNADRNQHMLKQRIIKLCLESRKKEIKYDLNSSYYLLNSLVTVSKKAVHDWLKNSDMKTLFIDDVENNVLCGVDMSDVTKIS